MTVSVTESHGHSHGHGGFISAPRRGSDGGYTDLKIRADLRGEI
jgi:hypothetical protein